MVIIFSLKALLGETPIISKIKIDGYYGKSSIYINQMFLQVSCLSSVRKVHCCTTPLTIDPKR
jgi:hypothetical protein